MINKMMKTSLTVAAAAMGMIALPGSASAEERDVVVTARSIGVLYAVVSYAGLNLANESGVRQLQQRLRFAVNQVCRISDYRSLVELRHSSSCRGAAREQAAVQLEQAVARAGSGQLAAASGSIRITAR